MIIQSTKLFFLYCVLPLFFIHLIVDSSIWANKQTTFKSRLLLIIYSIVIYGSHRFCLILFCFLETIHSKSFTCRDFIFIFIIYDIKRSLIDLKNKINIIVHETNKKLKKGFPSMCRYGVKFIFIFYRFWICHLMPFEYKVFPNYLF